MLRLLQISMTQQVKHLVAKLVCTKARLPSTATLTVLGTLSDQGYLLRYCMQTTLSWRLKVWRTGKPLWKREVLDGKIRVCRLTVERQKWWFHCMTVLRKSAKFPWRNSFLYLLTNVVSMQNAVALKEILLNLQTIYTQCHSNEATDKNNLDKVIIPCCNFGVVDRFCYLGDMLDAGGGAESSIITKKRRKKKKKVLPLSPH